MNRKGFLDYARNDLLNVFLLLIAACLLFIATPVMAAGPGAACTAVTDCNEGACSAAGSCSCTGSVCTVTATTTTTTATSTERVRVVECPDDPEPIPLTLGVPIGGVSQVSNLGEYVNAIYRYGFGVALIAAIVMVVYGGFRYLVGAGVGGVQRGKEIIRDALIGMLLIIGAYVILNTLNPQTTNFKSIALPKVGCEPLELPENLVDACETNADCGEGRSCVPTRTVLEPLSDESIRAGFIEGGRAITSDITTLVLNPSLAIAQAAGAAGAAYVTEVPREIRLCTNGQAGSPCGSSVNCRESGTVCSDGWRLCIRESNNPIGSPCDTDAQCSSGQCRSNPAFHGKKVCIGHIATMNFSVYQAAGYTFPEEYRCTSPLDCAGEEGIIFDERATCTGPAGSPIKACFPINASEVEEGSLCFFTSETRISPPPCNGSADADWVCMVCPPSGDRNWERMTAANNPQRNRIGSCKPRESEGRPCASAAR